VVPEAAEWAWALREAGHDVYHLPEYVVLEARLSGGVAVAFWYREDSRIFLLPLILHAIPDSSWSDAASPYGYPGPVSNADPADTGFWLRACQAMIRTLVQRGVVTAFVRLHPLLPAPLPVLGEVGVIIRHGETVSVDLTLSTEEMWRQTRRGHRREIGQARKANIDVVIDDWKRLDEWLPIYHDNMRRLGAAPYYFFPAEHLAALHDALGERIHLVLAINDGTVLGGNMFFEYHGIVEGYLASTRREDACHADKLLYHEVELWTKTRGNSVYHLGGGLGGAEDALFWYKTGFSKRTHPFHTWRVVADQDAFAALLRRKGADPTATPTTGYFPPYGAVGITADRPIKGGDRW